MNQLNCLYCILVHYWFKKNLNHPPRSSPDSRSSPIINEFFLQCRGGTGVCPDTLISGSTCSDDVRTGSVTGGFRGAGMQCVAFSRPFVTSMLQYNYVMYIINPLQLLLLLLGDSACDTNFNVSNQNQFIVWAIGGLGETAFIHFERANRKLIVNRLLLTKWLLK